MKLIGITIMVSLLMTSTIFSQNVAISDSNFYKALIIEGVDTNGDGQISYLEAEQKTQLNIREMGIINLNGIEAFINLDRLACSGNQLDSIDISNNHSLTYLDCSENRLTELDISENQLLTSLFCTDNRLTTLDVSGSPELVNLGIANNQITMLAVIESPVLEYLSCLSNQLTSLDVSNNSALVYLELGQMPTLHEVCVWTIPFPPAGLQVNTTDSPNLFFTKACYNQIVFIPDAAFLNALITSGVDMDHDSLIGYTEAALTANLYVDRKGITDVTGIEAFVNLDSLACSGNQLSSIRRITYCCSKIFRLHGQSISRTG